MKRYEKIETVYARVNFYRVVVALMAIIIVFIGMNNMSTTQEADEYRYKLSVEQARVRVLKQEINDYKQSLCLPRIHEMDVELGISE